MSRVTHPPAAKGRFIAFCDSDDLWYPTKLERQLEFMVAGDYGLTYTSYDVCDEGGHIKGYVECLPKLTYPTILRDNGIGCLTAIYDTRKMGKRYMPELHKRQDWCLWIHMIKEMGRRTAFRNLSRSIATGRIQSPPKSTS